MGNIKTYFQPHVPLLGDIMPCKNYTLQNNCGDDDDTMQKQSTPGIFLRFWDKYIITQSHGII